MKKIDIFKEETNTSLKGTQENTNKHYEEMNKSLEEKKWTKVPRDRWL